MMLKRSPFRSKAPPPRPVKQWEGEVKPRSPALRIADTRARLVVPLPKEPPLRSEAYRRWIATLPCAQCRRPGPSQCAHADFSKGLAIKASDATCFPLCADSPGRCGCHALIGSNAAFGREQRRALEAHHGAATEALARATGNWPKEWA